MEAPAVQAILDQQIALGGPWLEVYDRGRGQPLAERIHIERANQQPTTR
jgi:hypothetical protein